MLNAFGSKSWDVAFAIENVLIADHKPEVVHSHITQSIIPYGPECEIAVLKCVTELKELRHTIDLRPVRPTFELICGTFLVQDYSVIDLRKIADICIHYPFEIVRTLVYRCRAQKIYTLAYLAAALSSEAGVDVQELRREMMHAKLHQAGIPAPLPPKRPPSALLSLDVHSILADAELDRKLESQYREIDESR